MEVLREEHGWDYPYSSEISQLIPGFPFVSVELIPIPHDTLPEFFTVHPKVSRDRVPKKLNGV